MIRPYSASDIDDLLDVWYRASAIAHPFLSDEFLESERAEIAEEWLPVAETIVFEQDGRVVGFIAMVGNEVGGLFVKPDLWGRGIGRALMDHVRESRRLLELDVFEAKCRWPPLLRRVRLPRYRPSPECRDRPTRVASPVGVNSSG